MTLFAFRSKVGGLILAMAMTLTACTTSGTATTKTEIDANIRSTLMTFDRTVASGNELRNKAAGVLVFPEVVKGGLMVGGEYGQGALLVGGQIVEYFDLISGSIGFQAGVQVKVWV